MFGCESNQTTKTETHQNRQIGCFELTRLAETECMDIQILHIHAQYIYK